MSSQLDRIEALCLEHKRLLAQPDYRALARRLALALAKARRAMAGSVKLHRETDALLADPAVQALLKE